MRKSFYIRAKLTLKGLKYGVATNTQQLLNYEYDTVEVGVCDELLWLKLKKGSKNGFYFPLTDYLYEPKAGFHCLFLQRNGNFMFRLNGKWGVMNIHGVVVLSPIYDNIGKLSLLEDSEGYIRAGIEDKFGFINLSGEWIIEPKFDSLDMFNFVGASSCAALQFSKWGLIDRKGDWIITPKFDEMIQLRIGFYKVKLNEKFGIIDDKGQPILDPIYDDIVQRHDFEISSILKDEPISLILNGETTSYMLPGSLLQST